MSLNRDEEYIKMMHVIEQINTNISYIKEDLQNINSDYFRLINLIETKVENNRQSINELKEPFLLFVVGSGNYGKSTLINSLMRENVVETTNIPNTWKIDIFIKDKKEKVEIIYSDGTQIRKSMKEGIKTLKAEELKYKESKKKITTLLNEFKKNHTNKIEDLKLQKIKLEKKYLYKSKIAIVKYYVNKKGVLDDFIIVDTPGLNQTLLSNTLDRVKHYYTKSDGIIWMIDAQNLVSKESNNMIDEIDKIENLHFDKKSIIGVINKMDIITRNDIFNVVKVRSRAKEIYKEKFDELVFVSAKEAILGITSNKQELIDSSNINDLLNCIERRFKAESEEKQIKSKYKNLYLMRDNILQELYKYKRELYKDISTYNESKFEQNNRLNEILIYTNDFINDLSNKMNFNRDDFISKEISEFQKICSLQLKKTYEHIIYLSNFSKEKNIQKVDLNVYFTKSKYLVSKYNFNENIKKHSKINNPIEKILIQLSNNTNQDASLEINTQYYKNNIKELGNEILENINEKLCLIEFEVNKVRDNSFKSKHIEILKVKEHIEHLNRIENIIKGLR